MSQANNGQANNGQANNGQANNNQANNNQANNGQANNGQAINVQPKISVKKPSFLASGFSPLILPMSILFYTACQPTPAGIPYIIFLIVSVVIRIFIFKKIETDKEFSDNLEKNEQLCLYAAPFFKDTTTSINIFISTFSLIYTLLPMAVLSLYNALILVLLICYTLTMIGLQHKCYIKKGILVVDIFLGLLFGVISVGIVMLIGIKMNNADKNYLFVKNTSSTGETCSMASNQNFVCSVYKNGQLISSTPNIPGVPTT